MPKDQITTSRGAAPSGPYSQGISAGGFVFVAGQGAFDPETDELVGETIEEQTERTIENVKAILEAGGASLADVVKATVHLSDLSLFPRYNEVYSRYFSDPRPARTTVGSALAHGMMVEIEVIAYTGR